MKGSGILFASAVAVASTAFNFSANSQGQVSTSPIEGCCSSSSGNEGALQRGGSPSVEKFAPRFDGLRFIETLVTAHR